MRSFLLPSNMMRGIVTVGLFACMIQLQATDWNGGVITSAQNNIDTNFFISSQNSLQGPDPILIQANTQDVTATIGVGAVLLTTEAFPLAGRLHISAAAGRTVFFDLSNNDLSFFGSTDKVTRLLVSFSGEGQLVFLLGNNTRLDFAAAEPAVTAGTNFFVVMNNSGAGPQVTFARVSGDAADDVEVLVGRDSLITYIVDENEPNFMDAQGVVQFDPANLNPEGLMNLRLLNGASVDISGHLATITNGDFSNADVDLTSLGGLAANFRVVNGGSTGSVANLSVINANREFPHLRSNPFIDDSFTGYLPGFVLGANGILVTEDVSYLDYISTTLNACPGLDCIDTCSLLRSGATRGSCSLDMNLTDIDEAELYAELAKIIPPCNVCKDAQGACDCIPFSAAPVTLIKARNASALIVDGLNPMDCTNGCATVAQIQMNGCSGIYFRSGVDACGSVNEADGFIINPMGSFEMLLTQGAGNVVFDVEGALQVRGESANQNALRLLSTQVNPSGCPVIIASETPCAAFTVFPEITHNKSFDGEFLRYNKGAFLINNRFDMFDASLVHTDNNHHVLERDDLDRGDPRIFSEPTYIGGEFRRACKADAPRPTLALHNSIIRFHESAGFTGLDIQVPNDPDGNNSVLRFYSNGFCVDRGTGRILLLGTNRGDRSCVGCCPIDNNSHLDVIQTTSQATPSDQTLFLQTAPNDPCFTVALDTPAIADENSIQTIYLGNESNISIGTAPGSPVFAVPTTPTVVIDGAFFSFETQGGSAYLPELTGTLGEGAIFVDTNGVFENNDRNRASISTMVVRSGNGVIDLPETEIYFDSRVGVTDWQPNLNVDNVLVKPGELFSDFTIDWMQVQTDCNAFVPYDPKLTPLACHCPPVTAANLLKLPIILGTVDQLQVKRSRLGDQITLQVGDASSPEPGGFVRELIFLSGFNSAEAPMGTIVVDGWGRVGLGSASRNYDSNDANVKLGINGVTVIAKGDGVIELNQDIIIDNVCAMMPGPDFGATGSQTLVFFSDDSREFRIKSTGVLDLSGFKGPNQVVEFGGNMRFVFEPGAKLLLSDEIGEENRTYVRFTDTMSINFERVFDTDLLLANVPGAVEERLVKFIGNGDITMNEGSLLLLPNDTFLGIETDIECTGSTDIRWTLNDQAAFNIGDANDLGGTFQVGNRDNEPGAVINFSLLLNGVGTEFQIRRQGLVLFGVGGVSVEGNIPNNYTYECLNNVGNVMITIAQGTFSHNQIFSGDNKLASLLVVGPAQSYGFSFDVNNSLIRGGGNFALVDSCPTSTPFFSIDVLDFNGRAGGAANPLVGLFSSKDQLRDAAVRPADSTPTGFQTVTGSTPGGIFNYLKVQTYNVYASPKATIALNLLNLPTLGFITNNTVIDRVPTQSVSNSSGQDTDNDRSVRRGAVNISVIDSTAAILSVVEISGAV